MRCMRVGRGLCFFMSRYHIGAAPLPKPGKICYYKNTKCSKTASNGMHVRGDKMQQLFIRYFCSVMTVALIFMLTLSAIMESRSAQRHMLENAGLKLDQIARTLKTNDGDLRELTTSLREDYLTRCRAFAYMIEQTPSLLESRDSLNRVKTLLNVDELHVINADGILFTGTVPEYYGMDFRSTRQTAEFLQILDHPGTVLIQDIQPNGAEQKMFQYIGVSRQDQPGIVQIGIAPIRLMEAQRRNELPHIFSMFPVEAGASLFAIDAENGVFLAHSDPSLEGRALAELGFPLVDLERGEFHGFQAFRGEKRYYLVQQYDGLLLGVGQRETALYAERGEKMLLIFCYMAMTMIIIILIINWLVKKQIVSGLHLIMDGLSQITDGKLDTVVRVSSNPEFQQLSSGINKMVGSILQATVRVSKIIDMTEMPIGVFELHGDSSRVKATGRLRRVMCWTEEEAEAFYSDQSLFLEKLKNLRKNCVRRGGDVYRICEDPEKWIRLHMASDDSAIFGVATDVTRDILEQERIEHERDYDQLTGLCNISKFKRQVCALLKKREPGIAAAVMLDLDCFKQVNDQYGHDWGDQYLRETGKFLGRISGRCLAARRSGDEFCLFFHGYASRSEIQAELEGLYKDIRTNELTFPDGSKKALAISAGLAWYGGKLGDYGSMMKAADQALYRSKQSGRGIVSEYRPDTSDAD